MVRTNTTNFVQNVLVNNNSFLSKLETSVSSQVCSAGSRLIVQESCSAQLIKKIKERMSHLRLGDSLDKCVDMGAIVDPSQKKSIDEYVQDAKNTGAEVTRCFSYELCIVLNV